MSVARDDKRKKQVQPALTIPQQIDNLKRLGLTIEDEASAESFLNDVSYYRFIKAYSLGLKEKNGNFHAGVTFEQLKQLYIFNAKFRQLLFEQIEQIEINLRCRIANYFSLTHGPMGYLDSSNFDNYPDVFAKEISNEIGWNRRSPIIQNFRNNYENGDIPFYAVVEVISFGTLSKFYKNMTADDKKNIAASYHIPYTFLQSWIESIAYVRNVCAHYGRLYNGKLTKTPKLYREDQKNGISNKRIMGVLVCIKRLLPNDEHWTAFVNDIEALVNHYPFVKVSTMGFPDNWKSLLLDSDSPRTNHPVAAI